MLLNKFEFIAMNNPVRGFIQDKIEARNFRRLTDLKENKTILEIGCGNGNGTKLIKKYFRPNRIFAVDLDERMIDKAVRKHDDPSLVFMVEDASKLKFKNNMFDAVFDFGIIHHIPNWKNCLKEVKRVLKPGGQFILEDLSIESFEGFPGSIYRRFTDHPYKLMYRKEEFLRFFEEINLTVVTDESYNPFWLLKYFVVIAKK